ncbi:MAG TPA: hypothetical protein VFS43_13110 [Polyangiaceae bacterium]|nr:hypothetical protein [Polyangiaceae bacterium]
MSTTRAALALSAAAALALAAGCRRKPPGPSAPAASASAPLADRFSRCAPPPDGAVVAFGDGRAEPDDPLPFAAEVGSGAAYGRGFAVGMLKPEGRGSAAAVLTFGRDGAPGRSYALGLAHGDTPPPRPAARGDTLAFGLLEAGASTRRLRLGLLADDVAWGPSFEQGRDESFGFDLALGEARGVATWDDDERAPTVHGVIRLATFEPATLAAPSPARTVTARETNAEMPRVVARQGGFWLVWVASRPERVDEAARAPGEDAEYRWLEALSLDAQGEPIGGPKRISPPDGHVLTFDLLAVEGGRAVVVYRDDDVPSGGAGGTLFRVLLRPDGPSEASPLPDLAGPSGAPSLLPGWLAVADAAAETRLLPLDPSGQPSGAALREPVLGFGEPVAAQADRLLVVRPGGGGVRVFTTACSRAEPPTAAP